MRVEVAGVCERDLDLLLVEEFVASADFVTWFLTRLGLVGPAQLQSAAHSVTTSSGESDLEISVLLDERRLRVLIENKIDAGFQPRQAARYAQRATRYVQDGVCDIATTVLVAPRKYIDTLSDDGGFEHRVSYEDVLAWLQAQPTLGSRLLYKQALLQQAAARAASGWTLVPNEAATASWTRYWDLASDVAPDLELRRPREKPADSSWFYFKPHALPSDVQLIHKGHYGHVDLQFSGMGNRLRDMRERYEAALEPGMRIARANKSAVVRINVPPINIQEPFEAHESAVNDAIKAAQRLLRWYSKRAPLGAT